MKKNDPELVLEALQKLASYGYPVEFVRTYPTRKLEVLAALVDSPPQGHRMIDILHLVSGTRKEVATTLRELEGQGLIVRNHVGHMIGFYCWRIRMEEEPTTAPLPLDDPEELEEVDTSGLTEIEDE
jgi:hypothetical protein